MTLDLFPAPAKAPAVRAQANISTCGQYRWTLARIWDDVLPRALWVMLNPSTADHQRNDPTMLRVMHFSRLWGFGSLGVVNLYPFRSSSPAECRRWANWDRNGPDWYARDAHWHNENVIETECRRPNLGMVVAAWGAGAWDEIYVEHVIENAIQCVSNLALHCLGTTANGAPKHPLARGVHRVPDDQKPIVWRE